MISGRTPGCAALAGAGETPVPGLRGGPGLAAASVSLPRDLGLAGANLGLAAASVGSPVVSGGLPGTSVDLPAAGACLA